MFILNEVIRYYGLKKIIRECEEKMKTENEMKERKERLQSIFKALAVSWGERALGKMSHAGFNSCMEHVRNIVPEDIWNKISKATMHYHDPLESWIKGMKESEIPSDLVWMIGRDLPSIDKLQKMADELEEDIERH